MKIIIIIGIIFFINSCTDKQEFDLRNSGKCMKASSQCNKCIYDFVSESFNCTETICENEKFYCSKYSD